VDNVCSLVQQHEESQKKHEQIQQILEELSQSQVLLKDDEIIQVYYDKLADVYCDESFRHLYSEIFAYLTLIDNNVSLSLDVLNQNISTIYENCCYGLVQDERNCFAKIKKLYDHVNLDISRISTTRGIIEKHGELNENIDRVKNDIAETEGKIGVIADKAESIQREYITILGIFASIVVTFVAGMAFSSSILDNMREATIYRLLLTTSMLGLVLANSVGILTGFIERVGAFKRLNGSNYLRNINIVLCVMFVILMVMWLFGYGY